MRNTPILRVRQELPVETRGPVVTVLAVAGYWALLCGAGAALWLLGDWPEGLTFARLGAGAGSALAALGALGASLLRGDADALSGVDPAAWAAQVQALGGTGAGTGKPLFWAVTTIGWVTVMYMAASALVASGAAALEQLAPGGRAARAARRMSALSPPWIRAGMAAGVAAAVLLSACLQRSEAPPALYPEAAPAQREEQAPPGWLERELAAPGAVAHEAAPGGPARSAAPEPGRDKAALGEARGAEPAGPAEAWLTDPAGLAGAAAAASGPRYRVRGGDYLWAIAERELGDGERWPEIRALNPGLVGQDNTIVAGAWLELPPRDAAPAGAERGGVGAAGLLDEGERGGDPGGAGVGAAGAQDGGARGGDPDGGGDGTDENGGEGLDDADELNGGLDTELLWMVEALAGAAAVEGAVDSEQGSGEGRAGGLRGVASLVAEAAAGAGRSDALPLVGGVLAAGTAVVLGVRQRERLAMWRKRGGATVEDPLEASRLVRVCEQALADRGFAEARVLLLRREGRDYELTVRCGLDGAERLVAERVRLGERLNAPVQAKALNARMVELRLDERALAADGGGGPWPVVLVPAGEQEGRALLLNVCAAGATAVVGDVHARRRLLRAWLAVASLTRGACPLVLDERTASLLGSAERGAGTTGEVIARYEAEPERTCLLLSPELVAEQVALDGLLEEALRQGVSVVAATQEAGAGWWGATLRCEGGTTLLEVDGGEGAIGLEPIVIVGAGELDERAGDGAVAPAGVEVAAAQRSWAPGEASAAAAEREGGVEREQPAVAPDEQVAAAAPLAVPDEQVAAAAPLAQPEEHVAAAEPLTPPDEQVAAPEPLAQPEEQVAAAELLTPPDEQVAAPEPLAPPEEQVAAAELLTQPDEQVAAAELLTPPNEQVAAPEPLAEPEEQVGAAELLTPPEEQVAAAALLAPPERANEIGPAPGFRRIAPAAAQPESEEARTRTEPDQRGARVEGAEGSRGGRGAVLRFPAERAGLLKAEGFRRYASGELAELAMRPEPLPEDGASNPSDPVVPGAAAGPPYLVVCLGEFTVTRRHPDGRRERVVLARRAERELLLFLAVARAAARVAGRPAAIERDAVRRSLWPKRRAGRRGRDPLNDTATRVRAALRSDGVTVEGDPLVVQQKTMRLAEEWCLSDLDLLVGQLQAAARNPDAHEALLITERALALCEGPVLGGAAAWADSFRGAIEKLIIDGVTRAERCAVSLGDEGLASASRFAAVRCGLVREEDLELRGLVALQAG